MSNTIKRGQLWWDHWFLGLAEYIATASKDPSTHVGCVIVGPDREVRSTGFNGFPRGIADTEERLTDRALKYPLVCHAEENAIVQAALIGVSVKGCTAYGTWTPCSRCARLLIQAGILRFIYPGWAEIPLRWKEDFDLGQSYLREALVEIVGIPKE